MRIARECVNLRCSYVDRKSYTFPILRNRIENLKLGLSQDILGDDLPTLSSAMLSCSSLTKFHVTLAGCRFSDDLIKALFPGKMPFLKSVRLGSLKKSKMFTSFEHIASVTGKLKTFLLETQTPISPCSIFAVCQANPYLECIQIDSIKQATPDEETSFAHIAMYFKAFMCCRSLLSIDLHFSYKCLFKEELMDLCVSYSRHCLDSISIYLYFSNATFLNHDLNGKMKCHMRRLPNA